MRAVVADAGPLHYLVLIEAIELLPQLYGKVLVPDVVCTELQNPGTPAPVRTWDGDQASMARGAANATGRTPAVP